MMDLNVLNTCDYEQAVYGMSSVCMCGWMCVSQAPETFDGCYSYSVFKGLTVTDGWPVNINILPPKQRSLRWAPVNKMAIFLKNIYNGSSKITQTYGERLIKTT
jgi:hypothetical protein